MILCHTKLIEHLFNITCNCHWILRKRIDTPTKLLVRSGPDIKRLFNVMSFMWMMASRLWPIRSRQSSLLREHKNPWWITVIFDYIKCSVLRGSSQSVPGGTTLRRRIFPLIPIGDIKLKAISTMAYLKVIDDSGATSLGFPVGKSKLAPLKGHTIPRLELCGAVLAT
jgi:hypothetical protein